MLHCLLVLGVKADGYYWDHAVRWVRTLFLEMEARKCRDWPVQIGIFSQCLFPEGIISSIWWAAIEIDLVRIDSRDC